MRYVKKILLIGLLVYLGIGAFIFIAHRSMIYFPNHARGNFRDCPAFDQSDQIVANGTRAYYKHTHDRIIVVYHGNAGSACDRSFLKSVFSDYGYSYLFVEYAGYGGDEKTPSRELLYQDTENIVSFLKGKNYSQTLLFAESIGSGVASYHATLTSIDKLLFIAPFDSLVSVAQTRFPVYPMFLLEKFSNENYDNLSTLRDFTGDLRIIHGTKDGVIPFEHGKALFENINTSSKDFIMIEGAGHNDIYDFEKTWKSISDFL